MGFRMSSDHPNKVRSKSEEKEPKRLFFFFVEGEKTESIYFEELSKYENRNMDIDIRLMSRWNVNKGHSNQLKIVQSVKEYVDLIDKTNKELLAELEAITKKFGEDDLTVLEIMELVKQLEELESKGLINIHESFKQQKNAVITMSNFTEGYDKICIIIDRDKQSFKNKQFDEVIDIVDKNHYSLGLTNPNFEFYLLLHLDDCFDLDKDKIKNNQRISKNRKYTEDILKASMLGEGEAYNKNNYNCNLFFEKFKQGYNNSQKFASSNLDLKDEIGSSVFELLKEIFEI